MFLPFFLSLLLLCLSSNSPGNSQSLAVASVQAASAFASLAEIRRPADLTTARYHPLCLPCLLSPTSTKISTNIVAKKANFAKINAAFLADAGVPAPADSPRLPATVVLANGPTFHHTACHGVDAATFSFIPLYQHSTVGSLSVFRASLAHTPSAATLALSSLVRLPALLPLLRNTSLDHAFSSNKSINPFNISTIHRTAEQSSSVQRTAGDRQPTIILVVLATLDELAAYVAAQPEAAAALASVAGDEAVVVRLLSEEWLGRVRAHGLDVSPGGAPLEVRTPAGAVMHGQQAVTSALTVLLALSLSKSAVAHGLAPSPCRGALEPDVVAEYGTDDGTATGGPLAARLPQLLWKVSQGRADTVLQRTLGDFDIGDVFRPCSGVSATTFGTEVNKCAWTEVAAGLPAPLPLTILRDDRTAKLDGSEESAVLWTAVVGNVADTIDADSADRLLRLDPLLLVDGATWQAKHIQATADLRHTIPSYLHSLYDVDGSGEVTLDEFRSLFYTRRAAAAQLTHACTVYDLDNSTSLSKREFGSLVRSEFPKAAAVEWDVAMRVANANGDRGLSCGELMLVDLVAGEQRRRGERELLRPHSRSEREKQRDGEVQQQLEKLAADGSSGDKEDESGGGAGAGDGDGEGCSEAQLLYCQVACGSIGVQRCTCDAHSVRLRRAAYKKELRGEDDAAPDASSILAVAKCRVNAEAADALATLGELVRRDKERAAELRSLEESVARGDMEREKEVDRGHRAAARHCRHRCAAAAKKSSASSTAVDAVVGILTRGGQCECVTEGEASERMRQVEAERERELQAAAAAAAAAARSADEDEVTLPSTVAEASGVDASSGTSSGDRAAAGEHAADGPLAGTIPTLSLSLSLPRVCRSRTVALQESLAALCAQMGANAPGAARAGGPSAEAFGAAAAAAFQPADARLDQARNAAAATGEGDEEEKHEAVALSAAAAQSLSHCVSVCGSLDNVSPSSYLAWTEQQQANGGDGGDGGEVEAPPATLPCLCTSELEWERERQRQVDSFDRYVAERAVIREKVKEGEQRDAALADADRRWVDDELPRQADRCTAHCKEREDESGSAGDRLVGVVDDGRVLAEPSQRFTCACVPRAQVRGAERRDGPERQAEADRQRDSVRRVRRSFRASCDSHCTERRQPRQPVIDEEGGGGVGGRGTGKGGKAGERVPLLTCTCAKPSAATPAAPPTSRPTVPPFDLAPVGVGTKQAATKPPVKPTTNAVEGDEEGETGWREEEEEEEDVATVATTTTAAATTTAATTATTSSPTPAVPPPSCACSTGSVCVDGTCVCDAENGYRQAAGGADCVRDWALLAARLKDARGSKRPTAGSPPPRPPPTVTTPPPSPVSPTGPPPSRPSPAPRPPATRSHARLAAAVQEARNRGHAQQQQQQQQQQQGEEEEEAGPSVGGGGGPVLAGPVDWSASR